jgi:CCR4-NOT transcriptional regulation complex NOT5 subunit
MLNVTINKTDTGYIVRSSESESQLIETDASIESLMQTLKMLVSTHLDFATEQQPRPTTSQSLLNLFESITANASAEETQNLPKDGAEQHDHYLYGIPKREI